MKNNLTATLLLGATLLAMGTANPVLAADYNGTLTFNSYTASTTLDMTGTSVPFTAGLDLDRYNLGNALGGSATNVSFTTYKVFDPNVSALAIVFATDPNNDLVNDPTKLIDFATMDATAFLDANVIGWQYAAYGSALVPNGTTNVSALFPDNPMTFSPGTTYYAFVAGGSMIPTGASAPIDASVGYTLSIAAVPEPETWAMMVAGLGIVGLLLRRRCGAAATT